MPDYTGGQFPSLDGDPEAEVVQRTESGTEGNWFRRVFTVHNRMHTLGLGPDHESHRANFGAVLQAAIQQGLHPKCAPELESEEPHPWDPNSTNLTYRVQVVPAAADNEPHTTVTPTELPYLAAGQPLLQPDPPLEDDPAGGGEGRAEHDLDPPEPDAAPSEPDVVPPVAPQEPTE